MTKKKEKFNYKDLKVNEEELSITKIGELNSSEQSLTFIIGLFVFILIFIFFLPKIVDFIKGNNEKVNSTITENKNKTGENEEVLENKEETLYTLSNSLTIQLNENITLDAFSLNGNTLSYQVTNSGTNSFDFAKENYYLELYNNENTLLDRLLLETTVARDLNTIVNLTLSESTASSTEKLLFVKKEVSDYPNITLEKNDLGEDILVCSNEIEILTYKFQNDKLYEITDNINVNNTNENYLNLLNEWKTKSERLNSMNGVTSLFVDANTSFAVNTSIVLQNAKGLKEESSYYYNNNTLSKVVNFEMEARGFRCK